MASTLLLWVTGISVGYLVTGFRQGKQYQCLQHQGTTNELLLVRTRTPHVTRAHSNTHCNRQFDDTGESQSLCKTIGILTIYIAREALRRGRLFRFVCWSSDRPHAHVCMPKRVKGKSEMIIQGVPSPRWLASCLRGNGWPQPTSQRRSIEVPNVIVLCSSNTSLTLKMVRRSRVGRQGNILGDEAYGDLLTKVCSFDDDLVVPGALHVPVQSSFHHSPDLALTLEALSLQHLCLRHSPPR